uniref:Retrovirus-related Pol polyprotein from transposon TNT 1-94 n=1 Tax=Tanacetum cinerariifolium TaxID=118510 RepID=A0A699H215_TANCI|nr:retrovirus-related Pol polyprotein from transposon TNT 1-94 [Tanacetum cinerariifolium]
MQTQTLNALHNVIMEAGSKDRPPMLAPDKEVSITEDSSVTTTESYMENYKNVSQDINDQLNAKAEAVQIILTGIDNDIYTTVDACPNACEMWKAIERLKQCESINVQDLKTDLYWEFGKFTSRDGESLESYYSRNKGKAIINSPPPIYDQEPFMVAEDDEISKDKEIDKLMVLISLSSKKINKSTNNNLRTSSNTSRANQDNYPRINRGIGYDNQRIVNVAGARENVGTLVDDTDDESEDQELEAHYMYMAKLQEVTPDVADNSGPIFDPEPLQQVSTNDNYNVFAMESEHPEQSKSIHDTYPIEQYEHNVIIDSLDMSYAREQADQDDDDDDDDDDDLANERELLASLIKKIKCEIDDSKNRNKFLETSNKLVEILIFIVDFGCSKHMTGNLKLLINFVEKFLGSRGTDLYSITLQDTSSPNPICLMAKATSSQAWLWHRRLSHLNFDTINFLSKNDIVIGLPKLKFIKDHLCSSCELGKAKQKSFLTKTTPSSKRRLQLLHMDLCGPMRVESINGKKYVLVIVDDHSRYTWTHFLRSKDETPKVFIDFLRLVQRGLHA